MNQPLNDGSKYRIFFSLVQFNAYENQNGPWKEKNKEQTYKKFRFDTRTIIYAWVMKRPSLFSFSTHFFSLYSRIFKKHIVLWCSGIKMMMKEREKSFYGKYVILGSSYKKTQTRRRPHGEWNLINGTDIFSRLLEFSDLNHFPQICKYINSMYLSWWMTIESGSYENVNTKKL